MDKQNTTLKYMDRNARWIHPLIAAALITSSTLIIKILAPDLVGMVAGCAVSACPAG